jgi:hypothetical protein
MLSLDGVIGKAVERQHIVGPTLQQLQKNSLGSSTHSQK